MFHQGLFIASYFFSTLFLHIKNEKFILQEL